MMVVSLQKAAFEPVVFHPSVGGPIHMIIKNSINDEISVLMCICAVCILLSNSFFLSLLPTGDRAL